MVHLELIYTYTKLNFWGVLMWETAYLLSIQSAPKLYKLLARTAELQVQITTLQLPHKNLRAKKTTCKYTVVWNNCLNFCLRLSDPL